jgi:hypothetical protein
VRADPAWSLPRCHRLGKQPALTGAQIGRDWYRLDRGRIKIESKEDMRKRGLPSPDRADTAAMIFSGRANAAPINVESHAGGSITGDLMTKAG